MLKSMAVGLAALTATAAHAETLNLVCLGAGSANKPTGAYARIQDSTGYSAWGQVVANRAVPFDDQVDVEIADTESRIRLPRAMLPIARGGKNGWFKLKDLAVSDTEITGKATVNFMNAPNVHIDRRTGRISINGKSGGYSGECTRYDPALGERRF